MKKKISALRNKIKSFVAEKTLYLTFSLLSQVSNQRFIKLTYFAEKILTRDDPIIKVIVSEIRRYFAENHPCVELVRRILRGLNPRCRKALLKAFFINSTLKGACQCKEYADKEGFTPPFFLVLSPTMRCNLNCLGCSTRRYAKTEDLPIPIIDKLLNEAREMGIYFIVTQGGEMFLYQEMLSLYKKHRDIYFQVYTNGTLIDTKMARALVKLGNVAPMVSIEGFKQTTDQRRGSGVFDKIMQAMDNLRQAGCFFGASVCQTKYNTDEIISDEFFEMLLNRGCFIVWFFQFLPIGKDPDIDLMATPEQRHRLWKKVTEIRKRLPIFIGDFWNDGPFVGGCIAAGRRYVHINNKGDVEPCAFVHFSVDNIKNRTLKQALNSDFFRFLRTRQPFSNGNLLSPCMIIDDPDILRQAVIKTGAHPTHEGADVMLNGHIKGYLDEYSQKMRDITEPVWETIKDKTVKWSN
jgi:MoaA/NifB/PqqE/SkfB family radical SAM enzyme